jgi:hypothetical protein
MKASLGISLAGLLAASSLSSAAIFSEPFDYAVGSGIAGQTGGTGFSGAWSGGDSTIVSGIGGASSAVQVGSQSSSRSLSTSVSTSSGDIYIAYLMEVSNFYGGNYTGMSLWDGSTEQFFLGIPWQARKFGFDAHAGNGASDIKSVDFQPQTLSPYLIVLGLVDSTTSGKVDIKLWATSDLNASISSLVGGAANAQLLGVRNDFTFSSIRLAGDYSGSLRLGALGAAPTATEAAVLAIQPVPEPSVYGLALGALTLVGAALRRRRQA